MGKGKSGGVGSRGAKLPPMPTDKAKKGKNGC